MKRLARPLLLLLIFIAVDALVVNALNALSGNWLLSLVAGAAAAVATITLYRWTTRRIERKEPEDVPSTGRARALGRATLAGIGLFTATVLAIAVFGGFGIDGWGSFGGMLSILGLMTAVATVEEVLFRGILFRQIEERAGTWPALAVSATLFGLLHLVNDPAAIGGALAIVAAGLMAGAAYVASRSLWLPIGLHLGWNFAEGGIFGVPVSGADSSTLGLLRGVFDGPAPLTGGTFGPEASVFAVLASLLAAGFLLRLARRRGHLRSRPVGARPGLS